MSVLNFDSPAVSIFGVRRIPPLHHEDPGYSYSLERLPQEMFVQIISLISLSDLGNLSLTGSPRLREKIISWITSRSFTKKMSALLEVPATSLVTEQALDSWQQVTRDFGVLVKKVTMVHGSSYRLRLLSDWYGRLEILVESQDNLWTEYLSRMGLASALAAVIKGWDVVEFHKVLDWLRENGDHLGRDNRRLLRIYFWEFLDSDLERGKWTSWLVTTFCSLRLPITNSHQLETLSFDISRFFLTVFGPAKIDVTGAEFLNLSDRQQQNVKKLLGKTDFSVLCNGDTSWENLQFQVEELARAVSSLRSNLPEHLIISVVDTLFESSIKGSMNTGD